MLSSQQNRQEVIPMDQVERKPRLRKSEYSSGLSYGDLTNLLSQSRLETQGLLMDNEQRMRVVKPVHLKIENIRILRSASNVVCIALHILTRHVLL
jgi:hypothetical protein